MQLIGLHNRLFSYTLFGIDRFEQEATFFEAIGVFHTSSLENGDRKKSIE